MWREAFRARLRAARERLFPAARAQVVLAVRAARRRPEAVLAAAVVMGVAVMILHWS